MGCTGGAIKYIKRVDEFGDRIGKGESLIDGFAKNVGVLVVNVFIIVVSGASDFEALVFVE